MASYILNINPTLTYFLSLTLKMASNQLHISSSNWCQSSHSKATQIEFLSRTILAQRLSRGDQSFPQYFTTAMCKCTTVYNSSRWLTLERFSNFLSKVEYPLHGRRSLHYWWLWFSFSRLIVQTRLLRFDFFQSFKFTNGAHVEWLPSCCVLCHINFRSFYTIKDQ